jgi:hypothetical protein
MVHCGFEPSAVNQTFSGFTGMWATVKAMVFNKYANPAAAKKAKEFKGKSHVAKARETVQLTVKASEAA